MHLGDNPGVCATDVCSVERLLRMTKRGDHIGVRPCCPSLSLTGQVFSYMNLAGVVFSRVPPEGASTLTDFGMYVHAATCPWDFWPFRLSVLAASRDAKVEDGVVTDGSIVGSEVTAMEEEKVQC